MEDSTHFHPSPTWTGATCSPDLKLRHTGAEAGPEKCTCFVNLEDVRVFWGDYPLISKHGLLENPFLSYIKPNWTIFPIWTSHMSRIFNCHLHQRVPFFRYSSMIYDTGRGFRSLLGDRMGSRHPDESALVGGLSGRTTGAVGKIIEAKGGDSRFEAMISRW